MMSSSGCHQNINSVTNINGTITMTLTWIPDLVSFQVLFGKLSNWRFDFKFKHFFEKKNIFFLFAQFESNLLEYIFGKFCE